MADLERLNVRREGSTGGIGGIERKVVDERGVERRVVDERGVERRVVDDRGVERRVVDDRECEEERGGVRVTQRNTVPPREGERSTGGGGGGINGEPSITSRQATTVSSTTSAGASSSSSSSEEARGLENAETGSGLPQAQVVNTASTDNAVAGESAGEE